ncbi:MAG: SAP domain-containing protein [Lachnospiraceae bacterium]|nr:SAP domain-containing protein [Lachnospiraceae bacterium]
MEERPAFKEIKSYEQFSQYYWYREELKAICKELGIDDSGMKKELNHVIAEYFKGNLIRKKKKSVQEKIATENLTLDTGLLACGFCFNQRFREFFAEQTSVKHFKFNTDMVATVKKVKEDGDMSVTLGDLLDIYEGKKAYATYDKSSCQWNQFLKDFCADEENACYPNKLRAAAELWGKVRKSTKEKVYTRQLKEEFKNTI